MVGSKDRCESVARVRARGRLGSMPALRPSTLAAALALVLGACSAGDALPCAPERPAPDTSVRGRVVDPAGRSLVGVQVLVAPAFSWSRADQGSFEACLLPAEQQTRTEADGRFEVGVAEPGYARVLLRQRGYAELDLDGLSIAPGTTRELGEIALAAGARLQGHLVDEDRRPIGGARLARSWAEGSMSWWALDLSLARTDAEGRFTIDVLPPGSVDMSVAADGFVSFEFSLEVPRAGARLADGPLDVDPEPGEARVVDGELRLTLARGPTVRGRVERADELHAPWVLAECVAFDPGDVGVHSDDDLDPGRVRRWPALGWIDWDFVPVAADGAFCFGAFAPSDPQRPRVSLTPVARWEPWVEPLGPTVSLAPDEQGPAPVLTLTPLARAHLRVVDAQDGRALERLEVRVAPRGWHPWPLAQTTFPDGRVELALHAELLDMWIAAPGYLPLQREALALAPCETTELGTLALEPAPMLALHVVDAVTGAPIEAATVERGAWSRERRRGGEFEPTAFRTATTDAEGRVRIVAEGELSVHADGYADFFERRPVTAAARTIALDPAPRVEIRVLVTHASGSPAARWPLVLDEEWETPVFTDERGRALLTGPLRKVEASSVGWWSEERKASPWAGASAELEADDPPDEEIHLRLPELLPIELTILEAGRPLAGALVGPAHWDAVHAPTDGRGRVLGVNGGLPGPLPLQVWHACRPEVALATIELDRGRRAYTVEVEQAPVAPRGSDPVRTRRRRSPRGRARSDSPDGSC